MSQKETTKYARVGEAIPTTNFAGKVRQYVERTSGQSSFSRFVFQGLIFTLFKEFPTVVGSFLRGQIYKAIFGSIGRGCLIMRGVSFRNPAKIFFGNRVLIGEYSVIESKKPNSKVILGNDVYISRLSRITCGTEELTGQLKIGNYVHIGERSFISGSAGLEIGDDSFTGPSVTILTGNHSFQDRTIPIRLQGGIPKGTTIGRDVWLGANVTVLGGVHIGEGSVIGAGSVVTKSIEPYSIAVGIPAKVIGKRGETKEDVGESELDRNL